MNLRKLILKSIGTTNSNNQKTTVFRILKSKTNLLQINQELNNKIKIAKNIIMKMGNILIKTVKIVINFYRTKKIKIIKTITR